MKRCVYSLEKWAEYSCDGTLSAWVVKCVQHVSIFMAELQEHQPFWLQALMLLLSVMKKDVGKLRRRLEVAEIKLFCQKVTV